VGVLELGLQIDDLLIVPFLGGAHLLLDFLELGLHLAQLLGVPVVLHLLLVLEILDLHLAEVQVRFQNLLAFKSGLHFGLRLLLQRR